MASLASSILLVLCSAPALAVKGPTLTSKFPTREQLFDGARTITCTGKRIESFGNHCSSLGRNPGCANPSDVCYVKSGTHSQCRPVDRVLPTCWDAIEVVKCKGDKLPAIPPGPMKGRGCEPRPAKVEKAINGKKEQRHKAHNHDAPPRAAAEGTNCKKSDMDKGCRCAGRFWRCADKDDLITQACDIGLECVRKNTFYAVCSTPARKKWAIEVAGWEGTVVPCGVDVGVFGFSSSSTKVSSGGFAIAAASAKNGGKSKSGGHSHGKKSAGKKKSTGKKKSSGKKKKSTGKKKSSGKKKSTGKKHKSSGKKKSHSHKK